MKTVQLNARVDEAASIVLNELTVKLRTTKGHLVEKAIYILNDHFEKLEKAVGETVTVSPIENVVSPVSTSAPSPMPPPPPKKTEKVADIFLSFLSKSMEEYDELYRKLAGDLPKPR